MGGEQPQHRAQGRRLARAVRPDQPEHLAAPHVERQPVDGDDVAETPHEAVDRDQRAVGGAGRDAHFAVPAVVAAAAGAAAAPRRAVAGMPGLNRPSALGSATLIR